MDLSNGNSKALRQLVSLLQRGVLCGGDVEEVLSGLNLLTGSCSAILSEATNFDGWFRTVGLPEEWPLIYDQIADEDYVSFALKISPLGQWRSISEFIEPDKMSLHDKWEVFNRHGFIDGTGAILRSRQRGGLAVGLYCTEEGGLYTEQDRIVLGLLSPHLAAGFSTYRAKAAIEEPADEGPEQGLERADGYAEITLADAGAKLSPKAKALIKRKLGECGPAIERKVERMLVDAAEKFFNGLISPPASLLFNCIGVEFASLPPNRGQSRRLIALLYDVDNICHQEDGSRLNSMLTGRQLQIARLAARGKTMRQIAFELDLSLNTVRTHLKNIYQRLEISNRAELTATMSLYR